MIIFILQSINVILFLFLCVACWISSKSIGKQRDKQTKPVELLLVCCLFNEKCLTKSATSFSNNCKACVYSEARSKVSLHLYLIINVCSQLVQQVNSFLLPKIQHHHINTFVYLPSLLYLVSNVVPDNNTFSLSSFTVCTIIS